MILLCDCINSTVDSLYGKGRRPHSKLAAVPLFPGALTNKIQEYACDMCYYVRTLAQGKQTGVKTVSH